MNPYVYIAVACGAALLLGGSYAKGHHDGTDSARAEIAADIQKANERTAEVEKNARAVSAEVDHDHQQRMAELDAKYRDALGRIGPVRVRACPGSGQLPATAGSSSINPGAASGNRLPEPPAEGFDAGPGLVSLVHDADVQTGRLIACQAYVSQIQKAFSVR